MIKWLLVIGVVWFVYYFFIKSKPLSQEQSCDRKKDDKEAEEMLQCAKCGIYVEASEAILSNGKYYCSNECLKG